MRRTGPAACLVVLALVGCGDDYQRDTQTTTETAVLTVSPGAATPAQSTDGTGREDSERQRLTEAQRRDADEAKRAARAFLAGYLPFSYGQAQAEEIRAVAPALRAELARNPPRVPRDLVAKARPRLARDGLLVSGATGAAVILTAQVDDGQARYVVLVEVRRRGDRWLVVRVQ